MVISPLLEMEQPPAVRLLGVYSAVPGSGKSALAHALAVDGYERVPFASTLKAMLSVLLEAIGYSPDLTQELVHVRKEVPLDALDGVTTRHMLQTLGTEWGRQLVHPQLWHRCWMGQVEAAFGRGSCCIADDVRFVDEAELIRSLGGVVVELKRPGLATCQNTLQHASEGGLNEWGFDAVLLNNSTLEDLATQARMLVRSFS